MPRECLLRELYVIFINSVYKNTMFYDENEKTCTKKCTHSVFSYFFYGLNHNL